MPSPTFKAGGRPLRVCGVSGSALDRRNGFVNAVQSNEQIDLLVGDWMSEGNMPSSVLRKLDAIKASANYPTGTEQRQDFGYEKSFFPSFEPTLPMIAEKRIKVVVNAGASDAEALSQKVQAAIEARKLQLKVAWISGDDVLPQVQATLRGETTTLLEFSTGCPLKELPFKPIAAQAYLGGQGVAKALEEGADIVICGRVADASPVIGGAMWWHGWRVDQFNELAGAFIAGHLVECSTYITGGNFSGFKSVPGKKDLGYPIVEVDCSGDLVITKIDGSGGVISIDTVKAQIVYEIQGPWYYNSDVTALLENVSLEEIGKDRIRINGISGVALVTSRAGIEEKADLLEMNIRDSLGEEFISSLLSINFSTYGSAAQDPSTQNSATVDFRVFVQTMNKEDLTWEKWMEPVLNVIMCSYPGATMQPGILAGVAKPYCEYIVALIAQDQIQHQVHLQEKVYEIQSPRLTKTYPSQQPSHEPTNPTALSSFGDTVRGPLGWIVHARSGDKGSNANVGFWVRAAEEFDWLRSLLTTPMLKKLLGGEYTEGNKVDRFEFPRIWVVHFLLHDHLDRGVNSTSTYDLLGKNVGEFLRARYVDLPTRFLNRGKI